MPTAQTFPELLTAARQGDRDAIEELLCRHEASVRSKVHAALQKDLRHHRPWLCSMLSTGDVVQDVLISVLRDLENFEGGDEGSFAGYVATLVRNRLIDTIRFHEAMRRDQRRIESGDESEESALAGSQDDPARIAEQRDAVAAFCRIVATFPAREGLLLRERLEQQTAFGDIAESLGYPSADAARKAFYAAQARLLTHLRAAGIRPDQAL